MRIIETIPEIKKSKKETKSLKRAKEIDDFMKSGAKYGLIEFMTRKSVFNERIAYTEVAKDIGCADSVKFHVRNGRLYVERV